MQAEHLFTPNRRQALVTLLAGASLPLVGQATAATRKVAVIGGGMAGVACAWLLDGRCDVLLFESRATLGGNVQSLDLVLDGQAYTVDIGAQFFHPGPYPTYVQLLTQLGLYPPSTGGSHAFTASITLADPAEPQPRFVSPILPGRAWPLLAPWNRDGIQAFNTAFKAAQRREQLNASWQLSMGEWLPTLGLTQAQWEGMVLPWSASLASGDVEQAREISARAAMVFAAKALPQKPTDPIVYYVLDGGMIEPLKRMAAQFSTVQQQLATPVSAVTRAASGGFTVQSGDGRLFQVDDVVFASSGASTLALLQGIDGTARQRAAVQGIEFFDATLALHSDAAYASSDPRLRSFLNCQLQSGFCEASMDLSGVVTPPPGAPAPALWKSWVTHRQQPPSQLLAMSQFRHLLSSPATIRAQDRLHRLQGEGGVWFAGGWTQPYDAQETALLSAMDVAQQLAQAQPRPGG